MYPYIRAGLLISFLLFIVNSINWTELDNSMG